MEKKLENYMETGYTDTRSHTIKGVARGEGPDSDNLPDGSITLERPL